MSSCLLIAVVVMWTVPSQVRSDVPQVPTPAADAVVREAEAEIKANRRSRPSEDHAASDRKLVELVGELRDNFPGDPRLARLLPERWWASLRLGQSVDVRKEVRSTIASTKDAKLRADAFHIDAVMALDESEDGRATLVVAERFMEQVPGDDRAALLLAKAREKFKEGDPERERLAKRIIDEFPRSLQGRILAGQERRDDRIGKPFILEFTDAISGKKISMKEFRGKVVIIDFWATWCGPCVAEIPHFKELYGRYKDKGVEFIGVSLDLPEEDGGLEKLKAYACDNEIKWPQYYVGEAFGGDFTTSWGIGLIPVSFIVDAEGNLFSTQARGRWDQMIPLLLEKARRPGP